MGTEIQLKSNHKHGALPRKDGVPAVADCSKTALRPKAWTACQPPLETIAVHEEAPYAPTSCARMASTSGRTTGSMVYLFRNGTKHFFLESTTNAPQKNYPLLPTKARCSLLLGLLIQIRTYPARSSLYRIVPLGKHQQLAKTAMHALEAHTDGSMSGNHIPRVRLVTCYRAERYTSNQKRLRLARTVRYRDGVITATDQ